MNWKPIHNHGYTKSREGANDGIIYEFLMIALLNRSGMSPL